MKKQSTSQYINEQRRSYSLYVMQQRAIPAAADGLKAAGRRALWVARDNKKIKTATLAGATMPIHPHAECSGAINTLAGPYGNNIPLFKGDGAFGTLLEPTAYGAARYTAVTTSQFTQDVMFKDIEIIPMQENYDGTIPEPVHFLPLVPTVLLNPAEGIAIGFATNILPRKLDDIINAQLMHLKGRATIDPILPAFTPVDNAAYRAEETARGVAYYFDGAYEPVNGTTIRITKLPYGMPHKAIEKTIAALHDSGTLVSSSDDSKRSVDITLKFKKGVLSSMDKQDILKMLGLTVRHIENLNVLDFSGKAIWRAEPIDLIRKFTDWRLNWYVTRYERLADLQRAELQRWYDVRTAIKNKIGGAALKVASRAELKELLEAVGVINLDYIADLPVYRFTEEEKAKNETKITEGEAKLKQYEALIADPELRKAVYMTELQEVLNRYKKGEYK